MSAGKYNIVVEQGATFILPVAVYNSDGSAYDFTGRSVRGKIRADYTSTTALCSFTITGTLGTSGTFNATIGATITATLPEGGGVYDIEDYSDTDADDVVRLLYGTVKITPEATY